MGEGEIPPQAVDPERNGTCCERGTGGRIPTGVLGRRTTSKKLLSLRHHGRPPSVQDEFGKPGIAATYHEFKGALSTNLPENANPSAALNKLLGHFGRMADAECSIPEHLKCLIILAKLPSTMDNLAQMICQADDVSDLSIEKIQRQIQVAWEQRAGARDFQRGGQQGRGSANKLSTVKRPQGNPSFQQQLNNQSAGPSLQEQLEGNDNRGRGRG